MIKHGVRLVTIVAVLAGCAPPAQKQYYSAVGYRGSEECRALQAVIEDRERYGIVAASDNADRDVLRRCSLSRSGSEGPVLQTA
jgi:hypothetical protein